jgi:hypothetical protein
VTFRLGALLLTLVAAQGCASIHSYDAPRDINPAKTISLSSSVGATFDKRNRHLEPDGETPSLDDEKWKHERVLVPDAKLNVRIKLNEVLSLALDPLPPAAGAGIVGRWVPENDWAPTLTVGPMVNYLVFPQQDVWSIEVPVALSKRIGNHFVVYAGPKYLQQSNVLEKESGFVQGIVLSGVPKRKDQELRFGGGFAGFAFGWLHLQFSPEVIYYQSLDADHPEEVIQFGSQIRLAL